MIYNVQACNLIVHLLFNIDLNYHVILSKTQIHRTIVRLYMNGEQLIFCNITIYYSAIYHLLSAMYHPLSVIIYRRLYMPANIILSSAVRRHIAVNNDSIHIHKFALSPAICLWIIMQAGGANF